MEEMTQFSQIAMKESMGERYEHYELVFPFFKFSKQGVCSTLI